MRFEGKNLLNYTIGQRILEGKNLGVAGRELTPDLRENGPDLNTSAYATYSPYPTGIRDLAKYFVRTARRHETWLLEGIPTAPYLGSVLLFLLAFLGLVARPWDATRFFRELYIGGFLAYFVLLLLAAHLEIPRYDFPFLPFILLWASVGVEYFADWMRQTASELGIRREMGSSIAGIVSVGFVCWMFYQSYTSIPEMDLFNIGWAPNNAVKEAGLWLRAQAPGLKNTYGDDVFDYYSFSYGWILPYTDSETALAYMHKKSPDYIFLDSVNFHYTPYYDDWLMNGIPDPAATVIYQKDLPRKRRLAIYRWDNSPRQGDTPEPVKTLKK